MYYFDTRETAMDTNHIQMLCEIGDLNRLFEEKNFDDCLEKAVKMIADHMKADVSSIYLYEESTNTLTLRATKGLHPDSVNNISMKPGEGLVGTSLQEMRIICEDAGSRNPKFKHYPESGEDVYDSFLAVPLTRGRFRIGVIVVQRSSGEIFNEKDILSMQATASQLTTMLEHIKLLITTSAPEGREQEKFDQEHFKFLKGKSASEGRALAPVLIKGRSSLKELLTDNIFTNSFEMADFEYALAATEKQLEELQEKVEEKLSDAASLIFASHLLMLQDAGYINRMRELISDGTNPPDAVISQFRKYRDIFSESPNILIQEKVQDIEDLTKRILNNLARRESDEEESRGHVIVAKDLYPSDLLKMSAQGIEGVILVSGGVTSHVGILARSLRIPLVIIDEPELLKLETGTTVLIDADMGNLYINPSREISESLTIRAAENSAGRILHCKSGPLSTRDGTGVNILMNINLLSDLKQVEIDDIDGVGLYRTEFPFMIRNGFPSEEEQLIIYRKLIKDLKGKPAAFRTLDIGGDKVLSYYDVVHEANPFLGMRSIRFSLEHEDIFIQQIRAILRAGAGADLKIMFPMVSSLDEFLQARGIVYRSIETLAKEGYPHNENPQIGMMVEIPSVIPIIGHLAEEADFFSIGTNDLIQYTIAVDRTNEKVEHMYIPHHPAILASLKAISHAGIEAGIPVSICGDMANNEKYIPFLLGVGIRNFSVDAMYIHRLRNAVSGTAISEAESIAEEMLSMKTIKDLDAYMNYLMENLPTVSSSF